MKTLLRIAALAVGATLFYTYVGQMVPQKKTFPPEDVVISSDMTTEEMVTAGKEIVEGKGTCTSCHTIGAHQAGRFPDLGGIGAIAGSRIDGKSDIEYFAESLYDPNAYIVDGFSPGMLAASKPPISLSDQEMLTVIAYLQSLGGTPNVTMDTKHSFTGQGASSAGTAAAATAAGSGGPPADGKDVFASYLCSTCHNVETADAGAGPSLYDVGSRLSTAAIYESIMSPDASITEGFVAGVMPATLNGIGFYNKVSAQELKNLVDYLASLKGGQ